METKRDILTQVAEGTLSPEEAAVRLEQAELEHATAEPADGREPGQPVRLIKVLGDFRVAHITGDSTVTTAVAEGPHSARHEGDTLVIDSRHGDDDEEQEGFRFSGGRRRVIVGLGPRPEPVSVRMNPDLPLEVEIDAGAASIEGVRAVIKAHIDAGSIKVSGAQSPVDLSVDAGKVALDGVLPGGDSRIRCDAGGIKVRLREGTSVRLHVANDVGKVWLGGQALRGFGIGEHTHEHVFGAGAGTLDVRTSIGKIQIEGPER